MPVLGGDPGDPDAELVVERDVVCLADLLPCGWCGWMLPACPCGRPEIRNAPLRFVPPTPIPVPPDTVAAPARAA